MNWLHNPIADMPGPEFLCFFVIYTAMTLMLCFFAIRTLDPSARLPPLDVSSLPNPFEIAYLRGGASEVLHLIVFELVQRGFLQVIGQPHEPKIGLAQHPPDPRCLTELERRIFDFYASPAEVILVSSLIPEVEVQCAAHAQRMVDEFLLSEHESCEHRWLVGVGGGILLLGLAIYKVAVVFEKGWHDYQPLIFVGVVSVVPLMIVCTSVNRLSHRGSVYLKRLQGQFEAARGPLKAALGAAADATWVSAVSLFGPDVLRGTPYEAVYPAILLPDKLAYDRVMDRYEGVS